MILKNPWAKFCWKQAQDFWGSWERFWFGARDQQRRMAVFRSVLCGVYFVFFLIRTPDLDFFFSNDGIMQSHLLHEGLFPMEYRYSIFDVIPGHAALLTGHLIFLGCLLMMIVGWFPRLAAAIAFFLHVSFMHRNIAVSFGVDLIATFYLFYLIFSDASFSKKTHSAKDNWVSDLGSVSYRLCQVQLCVIYAYSGIEKLKGVSWWGGSALWDVLANPMLIKADFGWLVHFLPILALMAYLTLLWEVYFPVLIWIPKWRPWMLVFGVLFHVGIAVSVNIPFFSLMMMSFYILFIDREHWNRLIPRVRI